MRELKIHYNDDLLLSSGQSPEVLEQELRFLLAAKLFELRRLSLGKAAEFSGMGKIQFMDLLGQRGIAVINLEDDQIEDELRDC